MAKVKNSIRLYTTSEKIWPFIGSKKMMQWRTDVKVFVSIDNGQIGMGSRFCIEKEFRGTVQRLNCTINEWQENRKIAFDAKANGNVVWNTTYEIIPEVYGSKFIITEEVDMLDVIIFKNFFDRLFIQPELEKTVKSSLVRLKNLLDGSFSVGRVFNNAK